MYFFPKSSEKQIARDSTALNLCFSLDVKLSYKPDHIQILNNTATCTKHQIIAVNWQKLQTFMDSFGKFCVKKCTFKPEKSFSHVRVSWIFGKQSSFVIKTLIALGEEWKTNIYLSDRLLDSIKDEGDGCYSVSKISFLRVSKSAAIPFAPNTLWILNNRKYLCTYSTWIICCRDVVVSYQLLFLT